MHDYKLNICSYFEFQPLLMMLYDSEFFVTQFLKQKSRRLGDF